MVILFFGFFIFFWMGVGGVAQPVLQYPPMSTSGGVAAQGLSLARRDFFAQSGAQFLPLTTLGLDYSDPKLFWEATKLLFPTLSGSVDTRLRQVSFAADKATQRRIGQLARSWDTPSLQVKFDVQILEVNSQYLETHRGLFADLGAGIQVSFLLDENRFLSPVQLAGVISQLISSGEAKLLAKPTLRVLDGNRASIRVGDQVPYVTQVIHEKFIEQNVHFVDSGIELMIWPKGVSSNNINVEISALMNSVKSWQELAGGRYPLISTRKTETKVYVKPGKTLVLAGLYDEQKRWVKTGVPVLKDLPWVGGWFSGGHEEVYKTDVLFFITPWVE